ncbi:MAG TPA: hypothetical protein ENJ30_05825 [Desulfobulbaceae bacterium]|nr:hypothetical protein [Desulfobulbaceae bacterium]
MSETKNLSEKVEEINAQLRAFGREAVQEIKMMKDGQVIGQIRYGYKPQYVFDAVNSVLLPENWRYEVVSKEIFDNQVVAEVKLLLRIRVNGNDGDEWLCKGSQTGQMQIVKKNVGDAYKGAITGALQKCFSLLSIGSDAYKGLLKNVYFSSNRPPAASSKSQSQQRQNQSSKSQPKKSEDDEMKMDNNELPKIAGIKYQRMNGIVVATGNSFDKKELLKSAGFRWDGSDKHWYKEVSATQ